MARSWSSRWSVSRSIRDQHKLWQLGALQEVPGSQIEHRLAGEHIGSHRQALLDGFVFGLGHHKVDIARRVKRRPEMIRQHDLHDRTMEVIDHAWERKAVVADNAADTRPR